MKLASLLLVFCASVSILVAQQTNTVEATEGNRFEIAFPRISAQRSELPLPIPLTVVIHSRRGATVTIRGDGQADVARIYKTVTVPPEGVALVPAPIGYMISETSEKTGLGLTIESTSPVSVSTSTRWKGNMVSTVHLPTRSWGTSYHTFNYFQDAFMAGTEVVRCGQVMIVADRNATEVTVLSKIPLEAGPDLPNGIPANVPTTFTMDAHDVINLVAVVDPSGTQDIRSDLSGTVITSSKPIGVVSGHVKGGVGKMPPAIPLESQAGHFVRNVMAQALLPDTMAGTVFVTTPLMYTTKRTNQTYDMDTENRGGDVIRFVATANGTRIHGSAPVPNNPPVLLATIDAGETFTVYSQSVPREWTTSHPVLCMLYGKSWAKNPAVGGGKDAEEVEGHPQVESGMPFMMSIPAATRSIHAGQFYGPEDMDNFFCIVFKMADFTKLNFDGHSAVSMFGGSVRLIPNTDWAYVRTGIAPGNHIVKSSNPDVTFQAWSYCSLDGMEMGGAQGAPVGVGYGAAECDDDIVLAVTSNSTAHMVVASAGCALMDSYTTITATNALVDSVNYTDEGLALHISRMEATAEGSIMLRFVATNGKIKDTTMLLDMASPVVPLLKAQLIGADIVLKNNMPASGGDVALVITTALNENANRGELRVKYDSRVVSANVSIVEAVPDEDGMMIATIPFTVQRHDAGATILNVDFRISRAPASYTIMNSTPIDIVGMNWRSKTGVLLPLPSDITGTTLRVFPDGTTSVEDVATRQQLTIAPMPVRGVATISYTCTTLPTTLQVYDLAGALVMDLSGMLAGVQGSVQLDTHALARGSYHVSMQAGAHALTTRLVVE